MDGISIRFSFDYVDPGSYLAHGLLERWQRDRAVPVSIQWSALELRAPGTSRIDPSEAGWSALADAMRREAVAADIPFTSPSHVPWTRKAHELALHAHERGCFEPVHRALFEAHFVEGRDIGRVDELAGLAERYGLAPGEVRTVLGVDRFGPRIEELRKDALARGIRGVPTLEAGRRKLEGLESASSFGEFLEQARNDVAASKLDQTR